MTGDDADGRTGPNGVEPVADGLSLLHQHGRALTGWGTGAVFCPALVLLGGGVAR